MLEYRNITLEKKNKKILDNVNLKLEEGMVLGLLGPDEECAKHMLQIAAGSLRPTRGMVLYNEEPLGENNEEAYIDISYVSSNYGFHEMLSVEEYYDLFLSLYRVNGRYRERRIDEVLDLVGLERYKHSFIEEIPGELYPFLYLGKCILFEPRWLLLDEPLRNLSPARKGEMKEILRALQDGGVSMIINTQMFLEYHMLLTDVAVLDQGRLTVFDTIDEIMESAMRQNTIRMSVVKNLEDALRALKNNHLVERVIVDGSKVVFRFHGNEREEAELLTAIIKSGAYVRDYKRDPVNLEWFNRR